MRVLIPALVPQRRPAGVAIYVRELVRAWGQSASAPELVVVTPEPQRFEEYARSGVVKVWPISGSFGSEAGRAIALQLRIPRIAREVGADVILTPNFLAPYSTGGIPTAVVVQDLAFRRFPSTVPLARRLYYLSCVGASIRSASVLLVTTRTVGAELAEFEPSVASRIRTTPLGVSFSHLETVSDQNRPSNGSFLCVGTLEPRKNLARVLTAHGRLCRQFPDFPALRLVGAAGWGNGEVESVLSGHPDPGRVVRLGYCSDEELMVEYRRARALVFCSLYEGFGLPIAEAMHHGCPILCSAGTALAEVAGGAATLVDPLEVGEIESGMHRLAEDGGLCARLSLRGKQRAGNFTWAGCARRTIDALEELRA
jgi:glycosyltransferase involved in cell wall biosynthesis